MPAQFDYRELLAAVACLISLLSLWLSLRVNRRRVHSIRMLDLKTQLQVKAAEAGNTISLGMQLAGEVCFCLRKAGTPHLMEQARAVMQSAQLATRAIASLQREVADVPLNDIPKVYDGLLAQIHDLTVRTQDTNVMGRKVLDRIAKELEARNQASRTEAT